MLSSDKSELDTHGYLTHPGKLSGHLCLGDATADERPYIPNPLHLPVWEGLAAIIAKPQTGDGFTGLRKQPLHQTPLPQTPPSNLTLQNINPTVNRRQKISYPTLLRGVGDVELQL